MWISKKNYQALQQKIEDQAKVIEIYRKVNHKLEHDIRILININKPFQDVIFPNTDERGLGTDIPTEISDILEL